MPGLSRSVVFLTLIVACGCGDQAAPSTAADPAAGQPAPAVEPAPKEDVASDKLLGFRRIVAIEMTGSARGLAVPLGFAPDGYSQVSAGHLGSGGEWTDNWDKSYSKVEWMKRSWEEAVEEQAPMYVTCGINGNFDSDVRLGTVTLTFEDGTKHRVAMPDFVVTKTGEYRDANGELFGKYESRDKKWGQRIYIGKDGTSYFDRAATKVAARLKD
jgi:hypothetical protein